VQGDVATPDAALQPISEWRYRFGPLQEREQKRQYSSDIPADGLAWTYTLLGADAKQLASYNGIQGAFCGQPPTTAWLWPVEYNSYGPAHTRLIMRPTGAVEYVLHDHLGSARITLDNAARVIESRSYTAFGDELTSSGTGARTSYIGRETDNESDLGFYGVRMYEPLYGRFLSTDPLWSKYLPLQSYQYAGNSPVMMVDYDGREVSFASLLGTAGFDDDTRAQEIVDRTVEDLRWLTGLSSLSVRGDGVLTFDANETAQGGSVAARSLVTGLITSPEMLDVVSSGANEADPAKNTVGLNYDQTASFIAGTSSNLDNRTMGFGTTFLHEALHTPMGGGLDDGGAGTPGPVENTVNVIRSQMCEPLGQRLSYSAIRVHGVPTIPFSAASLTTIQEGKQPVSSYVRLPSKEDK
jgi:RHS repeat-associated protein